MGIPSVLFHVSWYVHQSVFRIVEPLQSARVGKFVGTAWYVDDSIPKIISGCSMSDVRMDVEDHGSTWKSGSKSVSTVEVSIWSLA